MGLISSFLSSSSPSSSSFLLQNEGGAKGRLHGVFGSRGAGAPLDPLLLPPLVVCELEELRFMPVLLGACKLCPTLRSELDEKNALIKFIRDVNSI